jgi:rRNA maturation RNase YbeY
MIFSTRQRKTLKIARKKFRMLIKRIVELANLNLEQDQIISISFVGPKAIMRINREFVNHTGLTDVISFDYRDEYQSQSNDIAVELIIHPGMAVLAASRRKHSTFAYEMVLYLVHGILHIAGENDLIPKERTKMRRREKKIIKQLQREFSFEFIFQRAS